MDGLSFDSARYREARGIGMKKTALIFICLIAILLLCGCGVREQNSMEITNNKTVAFINDVKDADLWLLPKTEENLKTTVWGAATASKLGQGESRKIPLCEPGADGHYILRMIDTDGFFYSAGGIALRSGWTIHIIENDPHSVSVEVTDENGILQNTYEVFKARL